MTKQQLKDYEKVQSRIFLAMWINDGNPDSVPESELLKLSLDCAISDIDFLLDNTLTELRCSWGDDEYRKELQARARKAKAFLKKYQ